jgi:hypothetical protein
MTVDRWLALIYFFGSCATIIIVAQIIWGQ